MTSIGVAGEVVVSANKLVQRLQNYRHFGVFFVVNDFLLVYNKLLFINSRPKIMSSKKKVEKSHSIQNPVMFSVVIDTDDDFTVDGQTHVKRNITVTGNGNVTDNLSKYLLDLHYDSHARSAFKVEDFKKMIRSRDFKDAIHKLTLPKDHVDYSPRLSAGGNHTIVITLADSL